MNKKIIIITAISIILYSYILILAGLFGTYLQDLSIKYGFILLKYGFILIGYIAAILLPYRITLALKQREEEKYQSESNEKIRQLAADKIKMENKIAEELEKQDEFEKYIKNEDAI